MTPLSPRSQRALTLANERVKELEAKLAVSEAERLALYAKLLSLLSPLPPQPHTPPDNTLADWNE